jgi:hypothetical protein
MRRLRLAGYLMGALLLHACGGGGGLSGQGTGLGTSLAGLYSSDPNGLIGVNTSAPGEPNAFMIVDGEGRMISDTIRSSPGTVQAVAFSGTALVSSDGTWRLPNALVWTQTLQAGSPSTVEATTTAAITGSYDALPSVTYNIPRPPLPDTLPLSNKAPLRIEGFQKASLSLAAGHYVDNGGTGPNPVVVADFIIDAGGRMTGQFGPGCNVDGSITVVDPNRNVYTAHGNLSGMGCGAGSGGARTFLGAFHTLTGASPRLLWAFVSDSGRLNVISASRQ